MTENNEPCTKIYPNYSAGSCGCGNNCACECGSSVGPAGPMGPMGPAGPTGATGAVGPTGATATNDNALFYAEASQTVANGSTLALGTSVINSGTGTIAASGTTGVTLAPGQYLVAFVSDAGTNAAGAVGAVLTLNGTPLSYTASSVTIAAEGERRIALTTVLTLTARSTLSVQNNTGGENLYENSSLTVVRLA